MSTAGTLARKLLPGVAALVVQLGPPVVAWAGWSGFTREPARKAYAKVAIGAAVVAAINGLSMSSGQREVAKQRAAPALIFGAILIGRILAVYSDRNSILTIPGGPMRWLGVLLAALGVGLFEWPRSVMGRQYSFMAAIQSDHKLVTAGPYRVVRHPGYCALLVMQLGYALVFRSALGLGSLVPLLAALLWRINDEEALLASEFGPEYDRYRERTARLIPFVY